MKVVLYSLHFSLLIPKDWVSIQSNILKYFGLTIGGGLKFGDTEYYESKLEYLVEIKYFEICSDVSEIFTQFSKKSTATHPPIPCYCNSGQLDLICDMLNIY